MLMLRSGDTNAATPASDVTSEAIQIGSYVRARALKCKKRDVVFGEIHLHG